MSDISSRQELSEPNNADLTPAERAFIASQVAMKNALDADIKNDDVQNEVQVLLDSISYLGHVLQMLNYRKQMPVYVQNGHINSTEDKKLIGELIQKGFQINEVNLSFVESNSQSTQEQAIQVTLYDHTPFSWDEESKFISSKTVTVSVGEGHTTNSAIPSKIKLQNSGLVPTRKTIKVAIPVDKNETTSQMLVYKMYWKTPADSLIISINSPINHLNHTISIRKTEPPTEDEYDWKKVIESSDWLSTSEIKVILDGGLYTTPTNVYVGVLVQKETSSDPTLTRRRRSLRTTTVEYKIISATVGCRVWDTVEQKWDKTSCQLSSASTINETVCECSNPPGNSFSTTFYVPPNTIDFGSVFEKFDLKNNAAVFATVVSLVLLYILLCVWAFRQDRKDHKRWALSYLSDNGPYDDYLYILTVFTGLHRNSGTKSRIGFMIIDGKPNKSHFYEPDVRLLDDETHRGFDVGSIRKFVMSVGKPINDPTVLKIWHDNSGQGNSASWYLNKIILEDVQTSESMEWGKTKSEEWLLCFFMSFIESMLLVDPLKIILISVIFSWIVKSYKEKTVKYDREKLLLETKRRAASPLSYLLGVFKATQAPLKSQTVARLKEKRQQRLKMQEIFIELVLYMIFLSVLYCVSFSNRDPRWYNVKHHLEQHLVTSNSISVGGSTLKYDQVTTASNLYTWIDDTLIPFLFPRYDNNGDQLKANRRLYVQDQVNFRVGPMRLRQLRAAEEPCRTQFWGNFACYDEYSISGEDDGNYCVAWEPRPCVRGQNVYNMTYAAWNFVSSVDIWGLPATGLHSTYGGGGYIAEFIVNYNISRLVLNDLYKYTWIDRKTRAIFTEFTLYNVDDNVFVFISFLTEFPETGGVIASTLIKPFRPYQHVGSLGLFIFICEIIVLIGITVFSVHKYIWFRRYGKKMWKELWHVLDILIIILFIVATIMYIGRWIMINMAMKEWENHKNKFVNFSHIASWDELFNIFLAFIIFLTTIRIMRVLSYNERINQFGKVLANVSRDLCGCFVMFMMVYVAFVTFGHLIFGRHLETYKNLFVSSTTLVNAIIGKNSIKDLFSVEPVLGRAYYFFFVLFLLWILMTMMNATLNVGITIVRKKPVRSTYGIINIVASFWREAVGHIIASNNTTTKDRLKLSRNYISSKTFTKTLVVTRQDETQQVDMVKPTEDLPKKKERARRIYQ
ncbi:location of vulva defective 1-like isoform X2 [Mytilus galloprovincialis]|uniref:location of vulva defective 1-like isoform X2 n=1 Tax=Mytilus galloprovincialis TaxID=29158 RepID=UPI003F7B571A